MHPQAMPAFVPKLQQIPAARSRGRRGAGRGRGRRGRAYQGLNRVELAARAKEEREELHFVTRYLWSQGCLKISVLQATFIYAQHPPDNPW